jgi:hypothetical protein
MSINYPPAFLSYASARGNPTTGLVHNVISEVQVADVRNRLVAVIQQHFHYLTAKRLVVDKKASDIGCPIKVHVYKASVSRFDVGATHVF